MERVTMLKRYRMSVVIVSLAFIIGSVSMSCETNDSDERDVIRQTIENSIGWALNKDKDLLYSCMAQDSNFFFFNPSNAGNITGFEQFQELVDNVFMNDAFKATGFEVKDLRIQISQSGTVAWYSAILDDFGEWNGQSTSWYDMRWTGVLEKREGRWVITQMHFSKATDAEEGEAEDKNESEDVSKE